MLEHTARTLAEATAWVRPHWRPDFLEQLVRGLPAKHIAHTLLSQAAMGDHVPFFALLDAAEEEGKSFDRIWVLIQARQHDLFTDPPPVTDEEQRQYLAAARWIAERSAPDLLQRASRCAESPLGTFILRQHEMVALYVNVRFVNLDKLRAEGAEVVADTGIMDLGTLLGALQSAQKRLRDGGVETLAELSHTEEETVVRHTGVIIFNATEEEEPRIFQVFSEELSASITAA